MKRFIGLVLTLTFGLNVVSHAALLPEQEMVAVLKQAELFVELQRKAGFSDEQILNDVLAQVEESKAALEPVMKLKTTQENQERMMYFAAGVVSTLVVGGVVWGIIHLLNKEDEKKDDEKKDEKKEDDKKDEPVSEDDTDFEDDFNSESGEDSDFADLEPANNPDNQGLRSSRSRSLLDSTSDNENESTSDEEQDIPSKSSNSTPISSSSSSKTAPGAPEQSRTRSFSEGQLNQIPFSLSPEGSSSSTSDSTATSDGSTSSSIPGPVKRVQFAPLSPSSSSSTAPQSPEREEIGSGSDSEQPPLGNVRVEITVGDVTVRQEKTFGSLEEAEEYMIDPSNITQTIGGTAQGIPAKKVLSKLPEQSKRAPRTTKQATERAKLEENRKKERAKTLADEALRVKQASDMAKTLNDEMPRNDVFESDSESASSSDASSSSDSEPTSPSSSEHSDSEVNHSGSDELGHDEGYESPAL
ncbi:hypothetical protein K2W90_05415 [Candidatus Babeliales bacterium]|nr:hypothetical protein [Candidatus Babeliales bacterium]